MSYPNGKLIKKFYCNCNGCRHSAYNQRTEKRFARGRCEWRNQPHKLRVKKHRQDKHKHYITDYSIYYTD